MAVGTPTGLANDTNTTALNSYATASQSPTANRIVLAVISNSATSTRPEVPSLSGNGITWVRLDSFYGSTTGTTRVRVTAFAGLTGASPSSGAATIGFTNNQAACTWSFAEFPGTHLTSISDAIRQVVYGESPDTHLSFEAHLRAGQNSDNAIWSGTYKVGTETITPGTGYTEIHEVAQTGPNAQIQSQYRLGTARLADGSWTTTSREAGVIAVELRAATNPVDYSLSDFRDPIRRRRVFKTAIIDESTAADNLIFTTASNKQAHIYGIYLIAEGTVTATMERPTTDMAPIQLTTGTAYSQWVDPPGSIMEILRDTTFEINLSAAVQISGWVAYWEDDI